MREFEGRVRFGVDNFGDSELARRFGVTRYPAFFVGEVLVATPKDFGFFGTPSLRRLMGGAAPKAPDTAAVP